MKYKVKIIEEVECEIEASDDKTANNMAVLLYESQKEKYEPKIEITVTPIEEA